MISFRSAANRESGRREGLGRATARHSEMGLGLQTGGLLTTARASSDVSYMNHIPVGPSSFVSEMAEHLLTSLNLQPSEPRRWPI